MIMNGLSSESFFALSWNCVLSEPAAESLAVDSSLLDSVFLFCLHAALLASDVSAVLRRVRAAHSEDDMVAVCGGWDEAGTRAGVS